MDMTPETGMERRKLEDMMQATSLRLIEVAKELQEKDAKVETSCSACGCLPALACTSAFVQARGCIREHACSCACLSWSAFLYTLPIRSI